MSPENGKQPMNPTPETPPADLMELDTEFALSEEAAEAEFEKWAAAWRIYTDTASMPTEDDERSFLRNKFALVMALREGYGRVEEDGKVFVLRLSKPLAERRELAFNIPTASARRSWDKYKDSENVAKIFAYAAESVKINPRLLSTMSEIDTKVVMALVTLFLA